MMPLTYANTRKLALGALSVAMASLLSACISVFPEAEPARLYRFGDTSPPAGATPVATTPFNVFLGQTEFNRASAGDRLLTVTGTQVAYIKGARWVTSAADLFNAAVQQVFSAERSAARLVDSRDLTRSDYVLALQVQTFEIRYRDGPESTPQIEVTVLASLTDTRDRGVAQRIFRSTVDASDNRVGPIVESFDAAVTAVLADLWLWVNARGHAADEAG